ncbi:hypothetical protein LEP1GSC122_0595 [Leptospira kirschneri serovar Valbuzzi str. 200702274]|nr:hypothetical protein LEP1GSC122_0595 [Leptospira kirschneri serovar Valbuzzi str. 200702274]
MSLILIRIPGFKFDVLNYFIVSSKQLIIELLKFYLDFILKFMLL